jgi:nucleoside-diphosphate-sugar epimerase
LNGIFLTGATGLVGGLLLGRLARENPERSVFALVHNRQPASMHANVHLLPGDITKKGLGMAPEVYAQLCYSISTIVHCAASTHLALPLNESRRINVEGTANVMALAEHAPRLKLLLHVSSTFVAGRMPGELYETPMRKSAGWFSPYEQSKFEAEQLILEQGRELPWVIARLSTLVGNSATGHIAQFNYFHQLLRLIPRNPFPIIPGTPDAPVDVVADDWVSDALLKVMGTPPATGTVLHLCAGPQQSLAAQDVLELAFSLYHRDRPNRRAILPSFVSLSEFESFLARNQGAEKLGRVAELVLLCLPHLEVHQSFLNAGTTALLARSGVKPLRTRDFLPRVMASCWRA